LSSGSVVDPDPLDCTFVSRGDAEDTPLDESEIGRLITAVLVAGFDKVASEGVVWVCKEMCERFITGILDFSGADLVSSGFVFKWLFVFISGPGEAFLFGMAEDSMMLPVGVDNDADAEVVMGDGSVCSGWASTMNGFGVKKLDSGEAELVLGA